MWKESKLKFELSTVMIVGGKDLDDVKELVQSELAQINNRPLKEGLQTLLVTPTLQMRKWDYSPTNEVLACWIVVDFRERDMGLAYSELGHGARGDHWGIVLLSANNFGRDDSWFIRLEDAFINSGVWHGRVPDDYEIP